MIHGTDSAFDMIWKVGATLFLCLLFPFALVADLLFAIVPGFSEGISTALRKIWREHPPSN